MAFGISIIRSIAATTVVCDYRGLILDVECRWLGSVHNAKMFVNSGINRKQQNSQFPKTYQCIFPGITLIPNYIIVDPANPLTPFCMKELDTTCSSNAEVVFNNLIRSGRNSAEYDFGRLTTRSSILTRKMDLKLDNIPTVCFVFQMLVLCYTIFVNIITYIK